MISRCFRSKKLIVTSKQKTLFYITIYLLFTLLFNDSNNNYYSINNDGNKNIIYITIKR